MGRSGSARPPGFHFCYYFTALLPKTIESTSWDPARITLPTILRYELNSKNQYYNNIALSYTTLYSFVENRCYFNSRVAWLYRYLHKPKTRTHTHNTWPSSLVRPSQTCRIRISPCPAMRDLDVLITDPRFVPLSLTRGSRRSLPVGDPQARHMDRDDLRDLEDLAASLTRPGNGRSHKKHRAMSPGTEHCPVSAFRFGSPLQSVLLVILACILAGI
ncbi:unnamed protein product [Fusarium graminearum]|uniref:Chromosome 2, complete genome n=2 Tax=Gibberella zeae TaxID=5518 RepID=I1S607_GIBZE|nr:hypothetical protein FGSG_12278 [Fusarium graminearum PH-1]CAF3514408.1 unnamed protein product [Fusarium graminearum]ESU08825.1 hypothetical protein FGSG_12278 [Fusarium graminearum PH-1]CAF3650557.1 unnamed protein product [Fusarium graminearum]CAG1983527.1 unnamed protein product [Fusarium graminearum]CEF79270.1 unnamed protein product [Fusarium graminearum]|eukprot:XP_011321324.1 hypothetical protein FGSG_12278 [Fusarium graminearum PH-1]